MVRAFERDARTRREWESTPRSGLRAALDAGGSGEELDPRRLHPGELVAQRFQVIELAGQGGMGAVYRAQDLLSGGTVALKIMAKQHGSYEGRFAREAQLLAQFSHPAIVRHILHGIARNQLPFLAMEWLEGEDLAAYLEHARPSAAESLLLVRRAAEALSVAHAHGVVHRDVKPSNLFLVAGDPRALKVLDFGLARREARTRSLTRAGTMLGTVGYMAPEQAMGMLDVDARADVFSLGCVLFECLTGQPPFCGQHDVAVLAKVLREPAPRVSELRPGLGAGLDALVARMLAKERELRPRSASALLRELSDLGPLPDEPPRELRPRTRERLVGSEQHVVSVILGRPQRPAAQTVGHELASEDADQLEQLALRHGAEPVPIQGGALLLLLRGTEHATPADVAMQAARGALGLRALRPQLDVAVTTGSVDTSSGLPVGVAIDRAAALLNELRQDVPALGVDDLTAGLLGERFLMQRKGDALHLLGEREHDAAPLLMGKPTPCVGREKELALLAATLEECVGDGVARAVLVTAAAGVGKSRLGREFVARVRSQGNARVLVARADPMSAGSALSLAQQLVRAGAGLKDAGPIAQQQARLCDYLEKLVAKDEVQSLAEFLGEIIDAPSLAQPSALLRAARNAPEVMHEQSRGAFERWLRAEARRQPLLLVLEDMHWGDLPSVTFLERALAALHDHPILMLAHARPELHEHFPQLWRALDVQEVRLTGLTRRAAERLARSALSDASDALIARVVQLADGNAFYLEELLRRVAEGSGSDLPETVLAMVQSRLERLDPSARRALRAASVFGETCWLSGVAQLLDDGEDVRQLCELLVKREVLEPRPSSRFVGELEYGFRHAFFREAAYAMLTEDDRCLAHRLVGAWLEQSGERDARVLADHFERGAAPRRAIPHLVSASLSALQAGDIGASMSLSRRGVAAGAEGRALGYLVLVRALASAYGNSPDIDGLEASLDQLPHGSDAWWLALALLTFGSASLGRTERALPYVELALRTPPSPELTGVYGQALQAMSAAVVLLGRTDLGWALLAPLDGLSADDPRCDAFFMAWVDLARCQLAINGPRDGSWHLERALTWGKESAQAMRAAGAGAGYTAALFYVGYACRMLGLYEESERTLGECAAISTDNALLADFSRLMRALVILRRGRLAEARAQFSELSSSPDANVVHGSESGLAECHFREGELERARTAARAAIDGPAMPYRRMAQGTLARSLLALGQAEQALEVCRRALSEPGASTPELEADLRVSEAEAQLRLHDREGAERTCRAALATIDEVAAELVSEPLRESFLSRVEANARARKLALSL